MKKYVKPEIRVIILKKLKIFSSSLESSSLDVGFDDETMWEDNIFGD